MKPGKRIRDLGLAAAGMAMLGLAGCGFHLRRPVALPPAMSHVHLQVNSGSLAFRRELERSLELAGVTLEDHGGPGVAEMNVPVATYSNDMMTLGGYTQVSEYAVRFHVQFYIDSDRGEPVVGRQRLDMQREYSYQSNQTIGTSGQIEQIERGMVDDMVQAMMLRIRAATLHPDAARRADPAAVAPMDSTQSLPGSVQSQMGN